MIRRFARPYARAVMDVAQTIDAARAVHAELNRFADTLSSSEELRTVFENPAVDLAARTGIVAAIGAKLQISDLGVRILDVLLKHDRILDVAAVLEAVEDMIHTATNTVVAEVRSAHTLSEDEKANLTKALESKLGKRVKLELRTDASLLGGFVATVGSEVWDASVVAHINKIRENLA